MLADQLDYVIGVDPHRDSHALAVVHVLSGAVVLEATVAASSDGYAQALKLVGQDAPGRRVDGSKPSASGDTPEHWPIRLFLSSGWYRRRRNDSPRDRRG